MSTGTVEDVQLTAPEIEALYNKVQADAKTLAESMIGMFTKAPATNQMQYYRNLAIEHLEESMHRISDAAAFLMQMSPEFREATAINALKNGSVKVVDGGKK